MADRNRWPWIAEGIIDFNSEGANQWPKISVVTPSFNQGDYLEETIRSVILQGYPNLQYIIIDGGSQDDSVNIIKKYETQISYWVSEKDRGQSDAINKGWRHSTGELFAWLNSDDSYFPDTLFSAASAYIRNGRKNAVIAGSETVIDETDAILNYKEQRDLTFENMVRYWQGKHVFQQPCTFFPGNFNRSCDHFVDPDLKYSMDYDLMCRILQQVPVLYIQKPLANFRLHNQSKTISQQDQMLLETSLVSQRYWPQIGNIDIAAHDRRLIHKLVELSLHYFFIGNISKGFDIFNKAMRVNKQITFTELKNGVFDKINSRIGK